MMVKHLVFLLFQILSFYLDLLETEDEVMTDQGFKIRLDLTMKQCTLCIPPSAAKGNQMTSGDVKKHQILQRLDAEQTIKRLKEFNILKTKHSRFYTCRYSMI